MYRKFSIVCQIITIIAGLITLVTTGKRIKDDKKREQVIGTDYREVH